MRRSDDIGFFHVCTDGRNLSWMFQDDMDFISGINRIAICFLKTGAKVIAYVLMDNHVHFVLYGSMLQCKEFINLYKKLMGMHIKHRYGIAEHLRSLNTEIIRIDNEESLLNTIAYIDRNSLIAGYRYMPGEYQWGSSKYAFKDAQSYDWSTWKPLSSLSVREQREILNTRQSLPQEWMIDDKGMICPLSFLDVSVLESYFKTPLRYSYFLSKKIEGYVENEFKHSQKLFVPDKELRPIVKNITLERYGTEDVCGLCVNDRLSIARTLRYNYASTIKQISRMVQLDVSLLEGFV